MASETQITNFDAIAKKTVIAAGCIGLVDYLVGLFVTPIDRTRNAIIEYRDSPHRTSLVGDTAFRSVTEKAIVADG